MRMSFKTRWLACFFFRSAASVLYTYHLCVRTYREREWMRAIRNGHLIFVLKISDFTIVKIFPELYRWHVHFLSPMSWYKIIFRIAGKYSNLNGHFWVLAMWDSICRLFLCMVCDRRCNSCTDVDSVCEVRSYSFCVWHNMCVCAIEASSSCVES